MPEFCQKEKRVGLHSAVFRELVLWPKGLGPTLWRKAAGTAKVRLVLVPWPEELAATRRVAFHPGRAAAALSNCYIDLRELERASALLASAQPIQGKHKLLGR